MSSREQEQEGFPLETQKDALRRYATQHRADVVKRYRIAETASKKDKRRTFRDLLGYVKKDASPDGVLFLKADRAAQNLVDCIELARVETTTGCP
ncbi:MAG: recombinase family protein [Planctomycetota bacterium]